jgi:hypothetical protein
VSRLVAATAAALVDTKLYTPASECRLVSAGGGKIVSTRKSCDVGGVPDRVSAHCSGQDSARW